MTKLVLSEQTVNIKLLGDSITHGVGGTGFEQNGEPIVKGFFRNKDGYCWAKLFKEYMESQYDCIVTNNACTGTTIEFVIDNFDKLVDANDDIVICTIGTNNRHVYKECGKKPDREEMLSAFYENVVKLYDRFSKRGGNFILVANIPATDANERDAEAYWRILHMCDINATYKKAESTCHFPFISLYDMMREHCEKNGIALEALLSDGLHPNNRGHEVMFELIKTALGI
jgi:lysophospholipase L1-like esterase